VGDAWACWAGLKEAGELDSTDSQGLHRFPELTGLPGLRGNSRWVGSRRLGSSRVVEFVTKVAGDEKVKKRLIVMGKVMIH
jgi:hypothetical protein